MLAPRLVTVAQFLIAVVPSPVLLMKDLVADMYELWCYRLGKEGYHARLAFAA